MQPHDSLAELAFGYGDLPDADPRYMLQVCNEPPPQQHLHLQDSATLPSDVPVPPSRTCMSSLAEDAATSRVREVLRRLQTYSTAQSLQQRGAWQFQADMYAILGVDKHPSYTAGKIHALTTS